MKACVRMKFLLAFSASPRVTQTVISGLSLARLAISSGPKNNIIVALVTGLELHRYGSLNTNEVKGPSRQRLGFWPILAELPPGSLLAFSDLRNEREVRAMFPGCRFDTEGLRVNPCVRDTPRAGQLNLMRRITRQPTYLCRRRAGFAKGHPESRWGFV